jgi:hypothetical protein
VTSETLYVVGQRRDGSYETFILYLPDGEGLEAAAAACAARQLAYIHCSRPKHGRSDMRAVPTVDTITDEQIRELVTSGKS